MKSRIIFFSNLFFSVFLLCNSIIAQVLVRDEPHHKVVLENDFVRLIDVQIPVHDTTLAHIHASPSVIVFLSQSTIGTQIVGGQPNIADVKPAQTSYAAYDEKAITHRVWNAGKTLFHVMDIELVKKEPAADTCAIISQDNIQFQWSQKLVHTYKIEIAPGKPVEIKPSNCAYLLIEISGTTEISSSKNKKLKEGESNFFSPKNGFKIESNSPATCVLLELK